MRIDLNCDLGEGAGNDANLMPLVSSANIACGGHAGDEATMRATVALAQAHGVAIGAHPGFADREQFGRKELRLSVADLRELVMTQVNALRALAPVRHVKPHGALYNLAARDRVTAMAIATTVSELDAGLILYGLAGSELLAAGRACGLRVASEAFADRSYQANGSLTPRSQPGASIDDADAAVAQALRMVREGVVRATDGSEIEVHADTLCVHGDGRHAVAFARRLREEFERAGIAVQPL